MKDEERQRVADEATRKERLRQLRNQLVELEQDIGRLRKELRTDAGLLGLTAAGAMLAVLTTGGGLALPALLISLATGVASVRSLLRKDDELRARQQRVRSIKTTLRIMMA